MHISLIITLAIISAFLYAASSMLQRTEAGQREMGELFRGAFLRTLSKNPKWLAAFGVEIAAFLFQAAALKDGSLILIQPIMTIDLVFLMLLLHFYRNVKVGKTEWLAIIMICGGLSGMLFFANPKSGTATYSVNHLIILSLIIAAIIAIAVYVVRRTPSSIYRAAIIAVAAGFSFALVDVFTKIVMQLTSQGYLHLLATWQLWALLITGIVAVIMTQNTYGAGPVAVSQPTLELVEPAVAIVLGIYLFGEVVNTNGLNLFLTIITGLIAGVGIVLLSRSKKLLSQGF